jgi:hypothetical protein
MLRLLSYNHLFAYVVVFLITVTVRLPSFHPNYFADDESFYLTCGQKIVDGGVQYVDTWDNKPPILVWFYAAFVWLFGSVAIIAIRIFTVIYIFVTALILNQFVVDNKLIERFSLLPAFLYIFLTAVPWYAQELNGEILINLPVILAVFQILNLGDRSSKNVNFLFWAGVLLCICFMIKYQALFLFFGLLGGYLTLQPPKLAEIFSILSGFFLSLLIFLGIIYLTDALDAYWDIGLLYNLDYVWLGRNPGEEITVLFNIGQYLKLYGPFLLFALIAAAHFRLNYFTNSIRLRKVEVFLLYWFGASLLTVIVGGGRLYLHYFYLMVPPIAIYVSKFFEMQLNPWVRQLCFVAATAFPLATFGIFLISAFPSTFDMADPYIRTDGWVSGFRGQLNEPHPLEKYIDKSKVRNGILVMAYEPTIYTRLGLPCATRYTNFSLAYFKLQAFRAKSQNHLISRTETLVDTYLAFQDELPEYIIDPQDLFPMLRDQIPILFSVYEARLVTVGDMSYKLYYR